MHCNLKAARCRGNRSRLLWPIFVLRMRTHCCLWASDQNFDIAIRFRHIDFIIIIIINEFHRDASLAKHFRAAL